ncbi:MAG TPA: site-2 protease family protein [Burkholderiales bacterium]|nr:site-2 protease family protein [Burkholderiales bacterium]
MESVIQTLSIYALPVIFAITLHEAAHGYVAKHFGDLTAYAQGRISLNPVRHIDPVGTIAVPVGLLVLSSLSGGAGFLFGWAKPVPVNFGNLRHPKRDMLWVAAAGPGANLVMALGWALMIKVALLLPQYFAVPLERIAMAGINVNLLLMVLNLLPIPPLDGGRMMVSLLPSRAAYRYSMIEPYGIIILLALLLAGVLDRILWPFVALLRTLISFAFQV